MSVLAVAGTYLGSLANAVSGVALANTPPPEFNPDTVTPGPEGFVAIFFVAALVVLLGLDMTRRIRRNTYRAQIKERLEAELAAKDAAETAAGPGTDAGGTPAGDANPGDAGAGGSRNGAAQG